ncbi:MAG: TMEM175 family protein [Chloroflexota bacterium]
MPNAGPIRSEQDLWNALLGLGPRLVTYLLSFLTLGIFWKTTRSIAHAVTRRCYRIQESVHMSGQPRTTFVA